MKDPKIDKFTYRHAVDENRAVELMSFAVGKVRMNKTEVSSCKEKCMCYNNYFCCNAFFAEVLIDEAKRERNSLSMEDNQ